MGMQVLSRLKVHLVRVCLEPCVTLTSFTWWKTNMDGLVGIAAFCSPKSITCVCWLYFRRSIWTEECTSRKHAFIFLSSETIFLPNLAVKISITQLPTDMRFKIITTGHEKSHYMAYRWVSQGIEGRYISEGLYVRNISDKSNKDLCELNSHCCRIAATFCASFSQLFGALYSIPQIHRLKDAVKFSYVCICKSDRQFSSSNNCRDRYGESAGETRHRNSMQVEAGKRKKYEVKSWEYVTPE